MKKLKMWVLIDKKDKAVKIPAFNDYGDYIEVYGFATKSALVKSMTPEKGDRFVKIEVEI